MIAESLLAITATKFALIHPDDLTHLRSKHGAEAVEFHALAEGIVFAPDWTQKRGIISLSLNGRPAGTVPIKLLEK